MAKVTVTMGAAQPAVRNKPAVVAAPPVPSSPRPPAKPSAAVQHKRMVDQLVRIFQMENPPVDRVVVVGGSLAPVDENFHLYKALVHTTVYVNGPKQHFSNIRFKTDPQANVLAHTITF